MAYQQPLTKEEYNALARSVNMKLYLDSKGIEYKTEGVKNVGHGWIGIKCVYCNDPSHHLGIELKTGRCHCFKCQITVSCLKFIANLEHAGFNKAQKLAQRFQKTSAELNSEDEEVVKKSNGKLWFPKTFKELTYGNEPQVVANWFERRNYRRKLIEKYRLHFCRITPYPLSLIVPVFLDGKMVSWQAMGLIEKQYLDCPRDKCVVFNKETLYGIDEAKNTDQIVLVEGITDKWRVGNSAVAAFTKNITHEQFLLLAKKIPTNKTIKVFLDKDTEHNRENKKVAMRLAEIFSDVRLIHLKFKKDPAELTTAQAKMVLEY